MKKAKGEYKNRARNVLNAQRQERSSRMAHSLMTNEKRDLWNEVKRLKSSQMPVPDQIDDAEGEEEICALFAQKYELYNSVQYNPKDMEDTMKVLDQRIRGSCDAGSCYHDHRLTVQAVNAAVMRLKAGKADCLPMFTSDQIIHGGDELVVHLTLLFNCMISHLYVPEKLKISTLVPITKNRRKSHHDSSNYRSIALGSIIGKVLDRVILSMHHQVLSTNPLQFGFKKKHSTTQCTFILQQVAQYYNDRQTPCHVALLDASKAFDRVEYVRLFNLLLQRGLCARVCKLLALLYTQQAMCVRWRRHTSEKFRVRNGVKQGGVLSPTLFCVYYDELLLRLERCGSGCYVGTKFVGALSYADDITLLAPSISAVRVMLRVCEDFAREYSARFNAEKSLYLVIGPTWQDRPVNVLMMNGSVIQHCEMAKHLGTFIGTGSHRPNVREAIAHLYSSTNVIMSRFGHCSSDVLLFLFERHCTSFYGCPLWDLRCIDTLSCAWRKCVKRVWKLPMRIRSKYVDFLSTRNFDDMIYLRFVNFFVQCRVSVNPILSYISAITLNLPCVMSENMLLCSTRVQLHVDRLLVDIKDVRQELRSPNGAEEDRATACALRELCLCRDGVNTLAFPISRLEILSAILSFCI
jgi:hypothetical protein